MRPLRMTHKIDSIVEFLVLCCLLNLSKVLKGGGGLKEGGLVGGSEGGGGDGVKLSQFGKICTDWKNTIHDTPHYEGWYGKGGEEGEQAE
ncbi:hypothetical protein E2C01_091001 [Portunus trituberculatus]|uniref:Uncharacterized protein n=1 Tax=Portunus trituberculatus TaxID=210409 RepID=A0A5B7JMD6_PORTR|nr:hypothetical protein [Portunus trituberculatus]